METVTRNVRDINSADRQALEYVLGTRLRENQQVIINVMNVDVLAAPPSSPAAEPALPEWCNVYAGLSDEEIDRLDQATRRRLDLTRTST